jgi:hypothetical protein
MTKTIPINLLTYGPGEESTLATDELNNALEQFQMTLLRKTVSERTTHGPFK